ncbi:MULTISPECIES: hypothetical protein [Pectobacterium]|nr:MULTISPECIES: hypothetical protein [Pectobacterium]MBL0865219.1 hypothetical protein [Pectobacterium carotovorum]MCQ8233314.1 hypothetical protein [Pectobacterium carotovorum]
MQATLKRLHIAHRFTSFRWRSHHDFLLARGCTNKDAQMLVRHRRL